MPLFRRMLTKQILKRCIRTNTCQVRDTRLIKACGGFHVPCVYRPASLQQICGILGRTRKRFYRQKHDVDSTLMYFNLISQNDGITVVE